MIIVKSDEWIKEAESEKFCRELGETDKEFAARIKREIAEANHG